MEKYYCKGLKTIIFRKQFFTSTVMYMYSHPPPPEVSTLYPRTPRISFLNASDKIQYSILVMRCCANHTDLGKIYVKWSGEAEAIPAEVGSG